MKPGATPSLRDLPPVLRRSLAALLALTFAALATKYICRSLLHLPEQYGFYVLSSRLRYVDYYCFRVRFAAFHHPAFFAPLNNIMLFTYPAPAALVYAFFYHFKHGLIFFGNSAFLLTALAVYGFARTLQRRGIALLSAVIFVAGSALLSYPLFANFWLGNTEIVLTFLLSLGLYFFLTGRTWAAATCLSLAGSLKLYPLVFLVLLLEQKQYRQIVHAIVLFLVVNVAGMWAMSGSVTTSWYGVQQGLEFYRTHYALAFYTHDLGVDHSLFAVIKFLAYLCTPAYPSFATISRLLRWFMVASGATLLVLYLVRIRKLPVLNQMLCLCSAIMLFSPGAKEYTLMNLYVPWGMLVLLAVEAHRERRAVPGMSAAFVCFTLLFAPLNEFLYQGNVLNGPIKAVLLLVLLGVGLRYPFIWQPQETPSLARREEAAPLVPAAT